METGVYNPREQGQQIDIQTQVQGLARTCSSLHVPSLGGCTEEEIKSVEMGSYSEHTVERKLYSGSFTKVWINMTISGVCKR